jgi:predicted  nucleic acid-binding Zn-ribbon protein
VVGEVLKLLRLQKVDGRIREARDELATFGSQREAARAAAASNRAAVEAALAHSDEREQEHRRLETELQDADRLVEKLDAQVYEVVSKQAMDAIQSELEAGQTRKSDLEDEILEILDQLESASAAALSAEAVERDQAVERVRLEEARAAREVELGGNLERLDGERAQRVADVEAEVLRRYEDTRRKAWPVLALVETKSCPVCRIVIPPQRWNEIAVAKKLVTCVSCHRILYGEKVASAL